METKLFQVVPDTESWFDWGYRKVKENPGKSVAIGALAVPFLVFEAIPVAVAGAVGLVAVGTGIDIATESVQIEKVQQKQAIKFRDLEGRAPSVHQIYARHPDPKRNLIISPAASFHSSMICEQIAHLIAFIRSSVVTKHIKISVYSEKGAKLDASVPTEIGEVGIKAHAGSIRHHTADCFYDDKAPIKYSGDLYWMRVFPEVRAILKDATKGSFDRSVSVDTTFGLSVDIAKSAGIDINWLGKQRFDIIAEFG